MNEVWEGTTQVAETGDAAKKRKPKVKHANRAGAPKREGAPAGGKSRSGNRRRRSGARQPG